MHALAGMAGLLALAWAMSENRRAIPWRAVVAGMVLLLILTLVFLKIPLVKSLFMKLNDVLLVLERATLAGTSLVFGYLGGGPAPFQVSDLNSNFVLAFRALPIVLVMSALSALLFYWRVVPAIVRALSFVLEKAMRVGGVVGLSTAANVFVGMVEAPLLVRPYLARLSRGELFAIMAGGMASIAGTVLFLYGSILGRVMPDAVAHLLIASILSAPAALVVAFLMIPPGVTAGETPGAEVRRRRQHGRADARHARRRAAPAQYRRHAGGVRRAGCAGQPDHRPLYAAGRARLAARAARLARGYSVA